METVLLLVFPDVTFRRERNDDRKYVCGSQASQSITNLKTQSETSIKQCANDMLKDSFSKET